MRKIIFLDIDGVLCINFKDRHPEDNKFYFEESCLRNLEKIVELTQAEIVISSSWRRNDLEWIKQIFKTRGFAYYDRIIGETVRGYQVADLKGFHLPILRGNEIKSWIDLNLSYKPNKGFVGIKGVDYNYVIIDDNTKILFEQKDNFAEIWDKTGLHEDDVIECVSKLNYYDNR